MIPEAERAAADTVDLVRRLAAGDSRAESELVERFSTGLTYMLRHYTGDAAFAEDIHQETFAVALQRLRRGELREPDKLAAFLRGTARNLLLAARRKRGYRPPAALGDDAVPEPADPSPDPLSGLIEEEETQLARRLLASLPLARDREILYRFCVAQEDREAIRAQMGLTPQQFNLVLFRARQRFHQLYQEATATGRLPAGGAREPEPAK